MRSVYVLCAIFSCTKTRNCKSSEQGSVFLITSSFTQYELNSYRADMVLPWMFFCCFSQCCTRVILNGRVQYMLHVIFSVAYVKLNAQLSDHLAKPSIRKLRGRNLFHYAQELNRTGAVACWCFINSVQH